MKFIRYSGNVTICHCCNGAVTLICLHWWQIEHWIHHSFTLIRLLFSHLQHSHHLTDGLLSRKHHILMICSSAIALYRGSLIQTSSVSPSIVISVKIAECMRLPDISSCFLFTKHYVKISCRSLSVGTWEWLLIQVVL